MGSNPTLLTIAPSSNGRILDSDSSDSCSNQLGAANGLVAHLVEREPEELRVGSSSLSASTIRESSSKVEHSADNRKSESSSLSFPTNGALA